MRKGCQLFGVTINDLEREIRKTKINHPLLEEIIDVFPKDIPRMPPKRYISFNIDLVPEVEPISKEPYKMMTQEMSELRLHLEELLEKGFITPSMPP